MNNSTLTIRTVGFRRLCRGYFRVLFFGFYSQKWANLSPPVVGLGPFWVLVDLFTGLVVPTTCFLTTCLTTCRGVAYVRKNRAGGVAYVRRIAGEGVAYVRG